MPSDITLLHPPKRSDATNSSRSSGVVLTRHPSQNASSASLAWLDDADDRADGVAPPTTFSADGDAAAEGGLSCTTLTRSLRCLRTACERCGLTSVLGLGGSRYQLDEDDDLLDAANLLTTQNADHGVMGGDDGAQRWRPHLTLANAKENNAASVAEDAPTDAHRAYIPPRSRGSGLGGSTPRRSQPDDVDNDSLSGSALSSTTTDASHSAVTLTRWGTRAGKERWVMQRGVLVCIGADGVAREATDSQTARLQSSHRQKARPTRLRTEDEDAGSTAAGNDTYFLPQGVESRGSAGLPVRTEARESQHDAPKGGRDRGTVVDQLESLRTPVYSIEELSLFVDRCALYLPMRVEVTPATAGTSISRPCPFALHIFGPLQPSEHAEVLGVLEDVLLEDCDAKSLRLTELHLCDVTFGHTRPSHRISDGSRQAPWSGVEEHVPRGPSPDTLAPFLGADNDRLASHHRTHSNAHLDLLPSLQDRVDTVGSMAEAVPQRSAADTAAYATGEALSRGCGTRRGTSQETPASRRALSPQAWKECEMRFLAFVKNVTESCADTVTSLHFTRCLFMPGEMGTTVPLPLSALHDLRFEQCPLTPAQVEALLQDARSQNRRSGQARGHFTSRGGTTRSYATTGDTPSEAGADPHATPRLALSVMEELQLSGTITEEAVADVLQYLYDDVAPFIRPALRVLRLPSLLVRAAREHPFVEAHPHIQVLPNR